MGKKKILLVDDEKDLVETVAFRLTVSGYDVFIAYDGEEALDKAKEKPDLILLDVMMPKMNGFQTIEKLKENSQTKDIPVIMLTAKSQIDDVTKAINLGAEDYIVKPFDHIAMLGKIKKALR